VFVVKEQERNLSLAHHERYKRTGGVTDLKQAIEAGEQAVRLGGDNHSHQGLCLHNLALAYQIRFQGTGLRADLELAVDTSERATASTSQQHDPMLAGRLHSLSDLRIDRFRLSGDHRDLALAVDAAERAVAATPQNLWGSRIGSLPVSCGFTPPADIR
jgi:hypothetical protein